MRNELTDLLIKLDACEDARIYAANFQTLREEWENCQRGDWMLWIYKRMKPDNLRELTLAKGHCAATVLHLMKDERSKKAVEVAIAFGEGTATREELNAAAAYAAYASASDSAYAYAYASDSAYASASAAAYAYAAASAAAYAYAADADARKENQKQTADICRKYLTETLFV